MVRFYIFVSILLHLPDTSFSKCGKLSLDNENGLAPNIGVANFSTQWFLHGCWTLTKATGRIE